MSTAPKVSVLIPTYNYARFLDEAIQSVLQQTFTDFELIITDNCSIDNTDEVVQKYLADERVRFHKNEKNLGIVGNWNRCLELASGTYIKFLCADDKFHPELLHKFVALMDRHSDVALITTYDQMFGTETKLRSAPCSGKIEGKTVRNQVIRRHAKNWLYGPTAVMFRKADADKTGKFNPKLQALIDTEYWLRLLNIGNCYVVPETLCYFRAHENTQTEKVKKKKYDHYFELYRFIIGIKETLPQGDPLHAEIDTFIKLRAAWCALFMYKVLPGIANSENRKIFRSAFRIAYSEGVLLKPISTFINKRIFGYLKNRSRRLPQYYRQKEPLF